jgi:hypothetical protein
MAKRKAGTTRKTTPARKPTSKRRKAAKRELIDTATDQRYVRRNLKGQLKESYDGGRSLSADRPCARRRRRNQDRVTRATGKPFLRRDGEANGVAGSAESASGYPVSSPPEGSTALFPPRAGGSSGNLSASLRCEGGCTRRTALQAPKVSQRSGVRITVGC